MSDEIRLAGHVFDPLQESTVSQDVGPSDALNGDAGSQARTFHIVQFAADTSAEKRAEIAARHGLRLDEYIPDRAYIVRMTPGEGRRLDGEREIRASRVLAGRHKISATIGQRRYVSQERRESNRWFLWVRLATEADLTSVEASLDQIGATDRIILDDRPVHGSLRIRFKVPTGTDLLPLAQHPMVRAIGEDDDQVLDNGTTAGTMQSGTPSTTPVWAQGLRGEDQIIGITDSVVDINHCWFADTAPNVPGPPHRKVVNIRNNSGSASGDHGTFVAGIAIGDDRNNQGADPNRGNAWAARCTFSNSADVGGGGGASLLSYLNAAASDGAFIHTNSWHDEPTPEYSQVASDVDTFIWNNEAHLVLGSSGNVGEAIGPPGTAKNAICVSASQRDPNEMNFGDGNNGPTADTRPRRKPDLFAPGCAITSALNGTACGSGGWPGAPNVCATSWATPAAAAAAILTRQYYTEGWYPTGTKQPHHSFTPSGALIKATLVNSTIDMTGIGGYGGNQEGFGLIRLDNALYFSGDIRRIRVWDTRNADGLADGETQTHRLDVESNVQQLRVVLVWSDPPAAADSADPYVNDLDLIVTSPDGTQVFRGNNFNAAGQSVTGGTADNANNVEVVVINTPALGEWTITVNATEVNVGNPGQGYAIVATADLPEAPETTGAQDTLVVRVKFSDLVLEPSLPNLQATMTQVANYINEVSWGQASISPTYRLIQLDQPKSYYYHPSRDLLIELTNDVVAKLIAVEPNLLNTGGSNDIDRMMIVTNDVNFTESVGTTGEWPYELPAGFTRPISVSVHGYAAPVQRFISGLLHQFGMVDLFAHAGVVFPRAYVDEWDALGGLFTGVHPLMWQKERAGWPGPAGAQVTFIPRPAAGASYTGTNPLGIRNQNSPAAGRKAIAIGLSQGVTTRAAERAYYWIEARDNAAGDADALLPDSGVLIYYVNEDIPQGEGPVIVFDRAPGTATLADAAMHVGDSRSIPGTGITITVQSGTAGNDYNIQVAYTPPITDYNVRITRGDTINGQFYTYYSPDIWVDSPANGFNLSSSQPAHEDREQPIVGQVNKLRARVINDGPGTAFDFDVKFRVSEPYHTVGGEADFDSFVGIKHIASLGAGASEVVSVDWTPDPGDDPHTCVRVDLVNLVGTDTNPHDNWAQENLREVTSTSSSPFHPVDVPFTLKNPYDQGAVFYFRADHVPPGWDAVLSPRKIWLASGEKMTGTATITPPLRAKHCTDQRIEITSWTPRGITLVQVGGTSVQVQLRRPTDLTVDIEGRRCDERTHKQFLEYFKNQQAYLKHLEQKERQRTIARLLKEQFEEYQKHYEKEQEQQREQKRCFVVVAKGCTNPKLPFQEIIVAFTSPTGEKIYQTVVTDENGCYEAMHIDVNGGVWIAEATYRGDKCQSETTTPPRSACIC